MGSSVDCGVRLELVGSGCSAAGRWSRFQPGDSSFGRFQAVGSDGCWCSCCCCCIFHPCESLHASSFRTLVGFLGIPVKTFESSDSAFAWGVRLTGSGSLGVSADTVAPSSTTMGSSETVVSLVGSVVVSESCNGGGCGRSQVVVPSFEL